VTLKAVGDRMGISHANILYHFGSASGLQGELMDSMVMELAQRISSGISSLPPSAWERETLIDVVFDAYDEGGGAQLAAWLALERGDDHRESYGEMVRNLADNLSLVAESDPDAVIKARSIVLAVLYMAFADGLIGRIMADLLQTPRRLGRQLALAFVNVVVDGDAASPSPSMTGKRGDKNAVAGA